MIAIEHIIFASHGTLADGMLSAVQLIMGEDERMKAYSLSEYESPMIIAEKVTELLAQHPGQAAILCDIKSGSVHNCLIKLCSSADAVVMTGMNLAMAIDPVSKSTDIPLRQRCEEAMQSAHDGISLFDRNSIIPALRKIYAGKKEEYGIALRRHMEAFNCTQEALF